MNKPAQTNRKKILGLDLNVFWLGVVSLLTDVSSEMIFTLVPLFLANVLGAAPVVIGLVGGISESTDAIFRIVSGWVSDRFRKRKALTVIGYGLSTLVKPLMYFAGNWGFVTAIRFGDRAGKGIRSSPRDALIASYLAPHERGRGFGFHRAMDSTGAVLGLGAAAYIIYHLQGGSLGITLETYRMLVLVGSIPAVIAVVTLVTLVREKRTAESFDQPKIFLRPKGVFSRRFKIFLVIMAIFTLGKSSDFFMILRAQDLGSPVLFVTLMLVLFNITYALTSMPAGTLSDRLGRRKVIALGWGVYALIYLGLALSTDLWQIWVLFAGYGIYYGITEGVARAFVADLVPEPQRGTAYGLYYGVVGLTLLPASVIGGWLWQTIAPAATFYFGGALALVATVGILFFLKE